MDMVSVERDFGLSSWRAAVGGGVRLTIEFFGAVTMVLTWPCLSPRMARTTPLLSFFIGLPFL
jgi:hypothetical protein